jgi:hypothetical protein
LFCTVKKAAQAAFFVWRVARRTGLLPGQPGLPLKFIALAADLVASGNG